MKSMSSLLAGSSGRSVSRAARFTMFCGLFLLSFTLLALAQEATLVGTVTDPTGSVVPKATITITSIKTGQTRTITTNDSGQYVAPDLAIGPYNVQAQAQGFKVSSVKNIVLNVADRLRVDFAMQVGSVQEQVTVEANEIRVQTDSGEVSNVITGQQVSQLTTNGRSIYTLINLTPGASSLQADFQTPTPVGGDANVSFNGNRPVHTIYLMDGGENLDRGGGGTFSVMPSIESLAEFRVLSSNYSAEYGLSSSATMTTALKSGTKTLHASAWEFLRNDALDARNYFNPRPNKVAELRFNTFGFNVGGPVDFWKTDHKTFFFYNMEWRKLIQGQTLNQAVPLPSTYTGNFAGTPVTLHTPCASQISPAIQAQYAAAGLSLSTCDSTGKILTAQPFPSNAIPASFLDANAQALLGAKIFPAPTSGTQFQGGNNSPTDVREEIVRVDHQFNDKVAVFGHWVSEQISQGFGTTMWSGDNLPTIGNTFGNPSYSAVAHLTQTINPSLLNEVAFNYNGNRINIIPKAAFGAPLSAPSGFTFNRIFTGPNASNRIPTINLQNTGAQYSANWTPWVNKADDYQIRDDVSWTRGAHQFKMGASWALYKKIQNVFSSTQGNFGFNGVYTGSDFADFLLGYAQNYAEDAVHDSGYWNNVSWAAYFQDNWRVNRKLTLNLGLRWDGVPHTYEANHRTSNFYPNLYDPAAAAVFDANGNISPTSPGLGHSPNPILANYLFYVNGIGIDGKNGIPKGLVDNHWAAFGPRIGFAYDPTGEGKTVVRGGFGTMYERIQGNDMYNAGNNVPFSATVNFNNVSLSDPHTSLATGNTLTVPIVVPNITGLARNNYKLPVSYQYSLGVQQSLGARSVLSLSYVGNQNRHQNYWTETNLVPQGALPSLALNGSFQGVNYNQLVPFQGFHSIRLAENGANAHYNSLQVDVHSNMRGLMAQFGYTYSRSIDPTTGSGGNGYDLNNISNPYVGWRFDNGPSVFDRTHVAFVNFVYDLPFFKSSGSRLLKTTLGGWALSGIVTMETGAPLNVVVGGGTTPSSVIPNLNDRQAGARPNVVGNISYPKSKVASGIQWFDPNAFAIPDPGTYGTLGHNGIRGPGRDNWNLSVHKSFVFSETRGSALEFRAEAYNAWNHTQWRADVQSGNYGANLTGSNFGVITQAYDPRVFQLGLKLVF